MARPTTTEWLIVSVLVLLVAQAKRLDDFSLSEKFISGTDNQILFEILENIAVPREPDTISHHNVRKYIETSFTELGWSVEFDEFTSNTPLGVKEFSNIIVTSPLQLTKNAGFTVLAAHYDSKHFPPQANTGKLFIGATDSAASCALLIDVARVLTPHLQSAPKKSLGLRFIFFDGEEAFGEWTAEDSLYGSRHLAEKWDNQKGPNGKSLNRNIESFILLDLLGAGNERIYNFFPQTQNIFRIFIKIEQYLRNLQWIRKKTNVPTEAYFFDQHHPSQIDDDHKPFASRGVKVVHLVPVPFPRVWHRFEDDLSAVNREALSDFDKIFTLFLAHYLNLD
eukprot:TRINITY_DN3065_c0_g5_i1.p1 TRINITY_DN3065_c0_g5~~TRINITY_DN3065_c0_g5_i1.p1  ORF type:complete len:347 (-),score=78.38 TRINITY_DN3065_c0_g5_i1:400-1410(-)